MEKHIMNIELQDNESAHGGIGHVGYTLGDFLNDSEIDFLDIKFNMKTMADINAELEKSGIKSVTSYDIYRATVSYVANTESIDYWQAKELQRHLGYAMTLIEHAKGSYQEKKRFLSELETLEKSMGLLATYARIYKD